MWERPCSVYRPNLPTARVRTEGPETRPESHAGDPAADPITRRLCRPNRFTTRPCRPSMCPSRPRRLAWSRTRPFHGRDMGSNPIGVIGRRAHFQARPHLSNWQELAIASTKVAHSGRPCLPSIGRFGGSCRWPFHPPRKATQAAIVHSSRPTCMRLSGCSFAIPAAFERRSGTICRDRARDVGTATMPRPATILNR